MSLPNRRRQEPPRKPEERKIGIDWRCDRCSYTNFATRSICRKCDYRKEKADVVKLSDRRSETSECRQTSKNGVRGELPTQSLARNRTNNLDYHVADADTLEIVTTTETVVYSASFAGPSDAVSEDWQRRIEEKFGIDRLGVFEPVRDEEDEASDVNANYEPKRPDELSAHSSAVVKRVEKSTSKLLRGTQIGCPAIAKHVRENNDSLRNLFQGRKAGYDTTPVALKHVTDNLAKSAPNLSRDRHGPEILSLEFRGNTFHASKPISKTFDGEELREFDRKLKNWMGENKDHANYLDMLEEKMLHRNKIRKEDSKEPRQKESENQIESRRRQEKLNNKLLALAGGYFAESSPDNRKRANHVAENDSFQPRSKMSKPRILGHKVPVNNDVDIVCLDDDSNDGQDSCEPNQVARSSELMSRKKKSVAPRHRDDSAPRQPKSRYVNDVEIVTLDDDSQDGPEAAD